MFSRSPQSKIDTANRRTLPMHLKVANIVLLFLGAVATVNSFRSVWYLLDSYFFPGE